MLVKSRIEGLDTWLFKEDIPDNYVPNYKLEEKEIAIAEKPIHLLNRQLATGGLFMMQSEIRFDIPTHIYTEVVGETVTSQFIFYKHASDKLKGKPNALYGRSRHNIRYIPTTANEHEIKQDIDYMYFLIVLSKDYYFNLIDRHSLLHEDFVREIEQGQYTSFSSEDFFVTLEMRRVIDDMVNCRQEGELKRIHTEARILELLMYQLEQLSGNGQETELIRGDDILKLENAREVLRSRYVTPPTQKELSREVGLNEFKLRRGFKEYFGITVYDYVTRLRMEEAKRLLLVEGQSISEVSSGVGFSHQNNFSIAFKKYFGLPPSELRG
ncbi:helix-turn-helix transcriptional regulator [Sphingobacterium corticibacter]|uniref:AraC family transcriptional regulator n=1 Tax=Sphingobacterium corticibacter TaxID=2171749 RepID=A0A2T8HGX3_9SPHI|nr:AraC family transcriptional regulator [Sphingobacterium corticibacter]PVH24562.1 AraC family transcriptional regulator [Sphingobacterium corticibacter]